MGGGYLTGSSVEPGSGVFSSSTSQRAKYAMRHVADDFAFFAPSKTHLSLNEGSRYVNALAERWLKGLACSKGV